MKSTKAEKKAKKKLTKKFRKIERAVDRVGGQRISFAALPDVQVPEDTDGIVEIGKKFQER